MINTEKLKFGIDLGFKLARLESVWGSTFSFAKKAFQTSKDEISLLVLNDALSPDSRDYQSFLNSIMNHYKKMDIEKFTGVMIGLSIQKSMLIGVLPNKVRNDEITASAKNFLNEIPEYMISDKNVFFEFLKSNNKLVFDELVIKVDDYLKKVSAGAKPKIVQQVELVPEPKPQPAEVIETSQQDFINSPSKFVFISYSTQNQELADQARALLKKENINCWMAPYDIPAGAKYAFEIANALEKCGCVLLLLTEEAQASVHVEREIEMAVSYRKQIVAMHLDDSELNLGFKYYIGSQQIVRVKNMDTNSYEIKKILNGINQIIQK